VTGNYVSHPVKRIKTKEPLLMMFRRPEGKCVREWDSKKKKGGSEGERKCTRVTRQHLYRKKRLNLW